MMRVAVLFLLVGIDQGIIFVPIEEQVSPTDYKFINAGDHFPIISI